MRLIQLAKGPKHAGAWHVIGWGCTGLPNQHGKHSRQNVCISIYFFISWDSKQHRTLFSLPPVFSQEPWEVGRAESL